MLRRPPLSSRTATPFPSPTLFRSARVLVTDHPCSIREVLIEDLEQSPALGDVAVTRALVVVLLAGEAVEEAELAEHRPATAHLPHQPLDRLVARRRRLRQELAALVGELESGGGACRERGCTAG